MKSLKEKITSIVPNHIQLLGKRANNAREGSQEPGAMQQIQDRGEFIDGSE